MQMRWILTLSLALFATSACVTHNDILKLDVPPENKATVYGMSETKLMFDVERDISILAIDGVNTFRGWGKGYPVSVELLPGTHTLTVLYRVTEQGGAGPTGEVDVEVTVRAGRSYVSDLTFEDGLWVPKFREVTDEEIRAAEEKRAQKRAEKFQS